MSKKSFPMFIVHYYSLNANGQDFNGHEVLLIAKVIHIVTLFLYLREPAKKVISFTGLVTKRGGGGKGRATKERSFFEAYFWPKKVPFCGFP